VTQPNFASGAPGSADSIVIGGGIVGASASLALAGRGVRVLLCERGSLGAEQSSRALGWVRASGRDPRDLPLSLETRRLWQELPCDSGYRRTGLLFACKRRAELAAHEAWLASARAHGVDARMLGAAAAASLAPHLALPLAGALHAPLDGRIEPGRATRAIATLAAERGAVIAESTCVHGIDIQAGRIAGVITDHGRIRASTVVVAAGAGSAALCAQLGVALPIQIVQSFLMATTPVHGPEISVYASGVGLRRTLDGRFVLGMQHRIVLLTLQSVRWSWKFLPAWRDNFRLTRLQLGARQRCTNPWREQVWAHARELFPSLEQTSVAEEWSGAIDVTPDSLPIISSVPRVSGLYIAAGFSGGGLGTGLGAGYLAADLLAGERPRVSAAPYRLERFSGAARSPARG